jgi:preprotein translocase subunit SecF
MRRLFSDAHYDFISQRRRAYLVSATALAICILSAIIFQFRAGTWLNYGVDFTGGTLVQVRFTEDVSVAELRSAVDPAFPGSQISGFGAPNEFLIRAPEMGDDAGTPADRIRQVLAGSFAAGTYEVLRGESVSAKVGDELQTRAIIAILLSFAATLIYLAIRFEWRFGTAAVIATFHDIILTLGLIAVLRIEVALPTVAAFLTIVGYSLNDTIVVFDRIRENLKGARKGEAFIAVLNKSINDTLPRTVLTSGTTLVTLLSLYLFGGAIIREFALILIFGILLGTYSSIFVAAPALLEIEKRWPGERRKKARVAKVARPA